MAFVVAIFFYVFKEYINAPDILLRKDFIYLLNNGKYAIKLEALPIRDIILLDVKIYCFKNINQEKSFKKRINSILKKDTYHTDQIYQIPVILQDKYIVLDRESVYYEHYLIIDINISSKIDLISYLKEKKNIDTLKITIIFTNNNSNICHKSYFINLNDTEIKKIAKDIKSIHLM